MHDNPVPHDCDPIDVCATCRGTLDLMGGHVLTADHRPVPVVACYQCGAIGEPVDPEELAAILEAIVESINRTAEGQVSWL